MNNTKTTPEKPILSKKKQTHRRTQSNSDFSNSHSEPNLRLSTPQHHNLDCKSSLNKTPSLTETNVQMNNCEQQNIIKKPSDDKQVIIETLDLTPQEQMKLSGTAGYGTINSGFFRFGKKRTFENCPKYLELMLTSTSQSNEEEKKHNDLPEIDISPLKEHNRNISNNYNKINEESMETESEISKRSSICRLSISKPKKDSIMKSDFIEAIAEILQAEDGKQLKIFKNKLRKKGHSKSCFSFNLQAFNLKLKNYLDNKKSVSIRKNEIIFSDSFSKINSSHTNSIVNFSGAHANQNLRKKSDESLMVNKINSSLTKHKKTSTSVFNSKFKNSMLHDKHQCMVQIQEFDKKIKEMEKNIELLQEKTEDLENENKSLSSRIIDVSNEKKAGDLEKEEYKSTIKELEKRIKNNENNIKKILNLMVQTDSTMITDWKQESMNSISQIEISLFSPTDAVYTNIDKIEVDSSIKVLSIPETPTTNNLISLINTNVDTGLKKLCNKNQKKKNHGHKKN